MNKIETTVGTPLTTNLINALSEISNSNLSNLVKLSFNDGVFRNLPNEPFPFSLSASLQGSNLVVTATPGKALLDDGTVIITTTNLSASINASTYYPLKVYLSYEYISPDSSLPSKKICNPILVLKPNNDNTAPNNKTFLGSIEYDNRFQYNYSNRKWLSFSTGIQQLVKLPLQGDTSLPDYGWGKIVSYTDHIFARGSGTITPTNPHGLSLRDIEGWVETKLTETHESQMHKNGVLYSGSIPSFISIQQAIGNMNYYYVYIQFPANATLFLKGKTFNSSNVTSIYLYFGTFGNNTFNPLPTSTYLIAFDLDNQGKIYPQIINLRSNSITNNYNWKYVTDTDFRVNNVLDGINSESDFVYLKIYDWVTPSNSLASNSLTQYNFFNHIKELLPIGTTILWPSNSNFPPGYVPGNTTLYTKGFKTLSNIIGASGETFTLPNSNISGFNLLIKVV